MGIHISCLSCGYRKTAYLQRFYDDGREYRYLYEYDSDFPFVKYFDGIEYDITYEEREFLYITDFGFTYVINQWAYVARYVSETGGTRYQNTLNVTKEKMDSFYKETQK